MDFRKLNAGELSVFGKNLLSRLEGDDLPAIGVSFRAELAAAIGTLPDEIKETAEMAHYAEAVRQAAIANQHLLMDRLCVVLSRVRLALKVGRAAKGQYD